MSKSLAPKKLVMAFARSDGNAFGGSNWLKWLLAGVLVLGTPLTVAAEDAELKSMPHDFLEQKLIERTKQGALRWDMMIRLGEPGDPENNPTLAWPVNRKEVKVGVLTISSSMPKKGAECEKINFDPLVMSDGIEPTNDRILLFRSPAYAISFTRRISGM